MLVWTQRIDTVDYRIEYGATSSVAAAVEASNGNFTASASAEPIPSTDSIRESSLSRGAD